MDQISEQGDNSSELLHQQSFLFPVVSCAAQPAIDVKTKLHINTGCHIILSSQMLDLNPIRRWNNKRPVEWANGIFFPSPVSVQARFWWNLATPSVEPEHVELRPAARSPARHKQLHIWAGRDAEGEPRGGRGPAARRVNGRGPEGDGGRRALLVLLAALSRGWGLVSVCCCCNCCLNVLLKPLLSLLFSSLTIHVCFCS